MAIRYVDIEPGEAAATKSPSETARSQRAAPRQETALGEEPAASLPFAKPVKPEKKRKKR